MTWNLILMAIQTYVVGKLPGWVAGLFMDLLKSLKEPTLPATVGDAPEALKDWLEKFLNEQIDKTGLGRVMKLALKKVADIVVNNLFDRIYNQLVGAEKQVNVRMMAVSPSEVAEFDALLQEALAA